MSIQAQLNQEALNYCPEVLDRIKNAGDFEANQMKCAYLKIAMELHTPLASQSQQQLKETENYILCLFSDRGWL